MGNSKHQDWGRTFNWTIAFFVLGAQKEKTHVKETVVVLLFVLQNQTLDNTNKLIVAWGLGCGEQTPGVYADVTKSLRFIDWATKCIDGTDKDYYGFGFGDRWAKHEYCEYKEKINDYESDVEEEKRKISSAGSSAERKAIRKNIRGYNKDIKKMKKLLPLYENAILNCARGKQDF